jgi:hypothetical protein
MIFSINKKYLLFMFIFNFSQLTEKSQQRVLPKNIFIHATTRLHVRQRVEAQLLVLFGAVERGDVEPAVPVRGARRRRALELPGACGVKTPPASQCKCELSS